MSFIISGMTVAQELGLFATVGLAVGCYLFVSSYNSRSKKPNKKASEVLAPDSVASQMEWDDRQPLFWRQSLGPIAQTVDLYFISAFSAELLLRRAIMPHTLSVETKICVSRSAQDTDKLIHQLLKKIEARLRRAELRPRPRLLVEREVTPFPLFSSTRPDIELSTHILNFLDACIDLSMSCDTQVNFNFETRNNGIAISAIWKKNHLIADATAQIELLDEMRLTMSGELVRWDYQIFDCPGHEELSTTAASALSVPA